MGVSITPRQIAKRYEKLYGIRVVRLSDKFTHRRFAICFRERDFLQPAALRLVDFLEERADA
jgi:DNA-binding transcriptional LysR family regulator